MVSQTIVKTFKVNPPQPNIFNFKNTESHLYTSSTQQNSTFKDISSYLTPKDPSKNPQENSIGCNNDDTEISIFDAKKYFSESNDINGQQQKEQPSHDLLSVPRLSSVSSVDGYGRYSRTRSLCATPTSSSEASWNSQTGLLTNPPGSLGVSFKNLHPDRRNKRWSAAKKWFLGRKCCCNGEKSVQVKEVTSDMEHRGPVVLINSMKTSNSAKRDQSIKETTSENLSKKCAITDTIVEIHHIKAMAPNPLTLSSKDFPSTDASRHQRISASGRPFIDGAVGFTFPILNASSDQSSKTAPVKAIVAKPVINTPLEDSSAFQPIHELTSISRHSSMDNSGNPIARDDDVGSDASSDLFEIETFSNQTTSYPMYRRKDSVDEDLTYDDKRVSSAKINNVQDGKQSVVTSECYPPSEVSTTTAEAAKLTVSALRPEKAVKCMAEGPPMLPLHVGGRAPRANMPPPESSHSARLSPAFAAA